MTQNTSKINIITGYQKKRHKPTPNDQIGIKSEPLVTFRHFFLLRRQMRIQNGPIGQIHPKSGQNWNLRPTAVKKLNFFSIFYYFTHFNFFPPFSYFLPLFYFPHPLKLLYSILTLLTSSTTITQLPKLSKGGHFGAFFFFIFFCASPKLNSSFSLA